MKKSKRFLSMLLVLATMLSMLPVSAFAVEEVSTVVVEADDETEYRTNGISVTARYSASDLPDGVVLSVTESKEDLDSVTARVQAWMEEYESDGEQVLSSVRVFDTELTMESGEPLAPDGEIKYTFTFPDRTLDKECRYTVFAVPQEGELTVLENVEQDTEKESLAFSAVEEGRFAIAARETVPAENTAAGEENPVAEETTPVAQADTLDEEIVIDEEPPEQTDAPEEEIITDEQTPEQTEESPVPEEVTVQTAEEETVVSEQAMDAVVQSGKCGDNLTWTLDDKGTLTIKGTGKMKDYSYSSHAPWYSQRSYVLTVSIESGVTSISDYAFDGCSSLTSITIPNSVTSTGRNAFYNCSSLTSITIPNSVTSIGEYAFKYCDNLTSITIPNSITSIGYEAFYGCSSLTSITIPDSVTSIYDNAFEYCSSLTSITIPNSVTSIGSNAFEDCSSLTSITIPDSVTSIGEIAFRDCSSLTSITIPDGVTSIGWYTFYGCSSLTSITIPDSVTFIGDYAFSGCSSLTSITIPDSVTSIYDNAFEYCSSLTSITIPNSVTSIGYGAFTYCRNLTSITIPNSVTSIDGCVFDGCSSLTSITIPDSVTSIGDCAFESCSSLTSITIPDGVTSISWGAFDGCSSLTSITIPNSVTSIGDYAFKGCSSLTSITIPNSVTGIGECAFYRCSGLTSIAIPDSVTSIGGHAFYDCSSLTSITFQGNAPSMSGECFVSVNATAYHPANNPTWTDSVKQNYNGTIVWEPYDPATRNLLKISEGPIQVGVGKKAIVQAAYYGYNGELSDISGGITWSALSPASGGEVDIRIISDYYEYCLCEVTGRRAGQCSVTASTKTGLTASVQINVTAPQPVQKQTVPETQPKGHLSGSQNYTLAEDASGTIDLSAPIVSEVTLKAGSRYSADTPIIVKKGGELIVNGSLTAQEIQVQSGGTLTIFGDVYATSVSIEGGSWFSDGGLLQGGGTLRVQNQLTFKGKGRCETTGQIMAYNQFSYTSSSGIEKMSGTLFLGGSVEIGKAFRSEQGLLSTVFYDGAQDVSYSFHKNCNLGKVYAPSVDKYNSLYLSGDNSVSATKYLSLNKPDHGTWSFVPSNIKLEAELEDNLGAFSANLAAQRQTAVLVGSYPGLSADECDFVSRLGDLWIGNIQAQVNRGMLEFTQSTYEMEFKLNRKKYMFRYVLDADGGYANMGTVYFGTNEKDLSPIGLSASGSIENFKAQATTYLAESYVKEYYTFVTGSLPKGKSEATLIGKLKRGGEKYVRKYMENMVEEYLFGTLKTTKPDSYRELEKTFSISRMIVDGDCKGLWKYAYKEAKGVLTTNSVSTSSANAKATALLAAPKKSYDVSDEITDEYLKAALIEVLGADGNGQPDFSKQDQITYLDLSGRYIQTLNGIQRFTNLKTLMIHDNEISDLSPLNQMDSLIFLNASGQNISDLSPLSGLSHLKYLDVSDNVLDSLYGLDQLSSLEELNICGNDITSLAALSSMTKLKKLYAVDLCLSDADLSSLGQCASLEEVYLDGSELVSIDGINVDALRILSISGNSIANIDTLKNAVKLERVDASDNEIETVPSFAQCRNLTHLNLSDNMLLDLDAIADANSLVELDLSSCDITDYDLEFVSSINSLKNLNIAYNVVEDVLPLLSQKSLQRVDITGTDVVLEEYRGKGAQITFVRNEEELSIPETESISGASVTVSNVTYSGDAQCPTVTVTLNGHVLEPDDYSVEYVNNINAGTATAVVTGRGSYTGSIRKTFTIKAISIANAELAGISNKTYTGKAITQMPTVKVNGKTLTNGTDYTVSYTNNTNAGTAKVTVTGKGNYTGTITKTFQINKAKQAIAVTPVSVLKSKTVTLNVKNSYGKLTYVTSNKNVATVTTKGVVKGVKAGTVNITVKAAGDKNHESVTQKVKFTVYACATPKVSKVENVNGGVKLTWGKVAGAVKYRIFYKTGKAGWTKLADTTSTTYTWKKAKNGTTYAFTVRCISKDGKAYTSGHNTTGKSLTYVATPTLSSVKNSKAKTMTASWKKLSSVTGFQIQYSTNKNFKSGNKTVTVKKASAVSQVISGLTKSKTYYVRIRSYKTVSGKNVYSSWSAAKSVKIAK